MKFIAGLALLILAGCEEPVTLDGQSMFMPACLLICVEGQWVTEGGQNAVP